MNLDAGTEPVQSAITSTSFSKDIWGMFISSNPSSLEDIERLAEDGWWTDMDKLVYPEVMALWDEWYWTAPKWMTVGDVLFFYQTKSVKQRISRLIREWRNHFGPDSALTSILERNLRHAEQYSGTIFASARVIGPARYMRDDYETLFKDRIFARIDDVHLFGRPLSLGEFSDVVSIGQSTNTPLHGSSFEEIKRRLEAHNVLPDYLEAARPGGKTFRDVDKDNWRSISCDEANVHFLDEDQLRKYLLDFLLAEVKDPRTPLLAECRCFRDGAGTGRADYFLKIDGSWVPVEAKLSVLSEKDLSAQLRQYNRVEEFVPTLAPNKGTRYPKNGENVEQSVCLVADQAGVYLTRDGEFVDGCSLEEPLWRRGDLDESTPEAIRQRVREASV